MADFLRCKDCKHDKGKCVGVSRRASHKHCFEPKVTTNADRIRAMSDEELAKRDVEIVLDTMEQLGIKNTASKKKQ